MTRSSFDAIIVGAGPAGASVAILLAHAGWSVAVVEKLPFPRRKVCGECISATNLALLHALGIGDTFDALAGPALTSVAVMQGQRSIRAALPPSDVPDYPYGRALGREHLDVLLLERARSAGATIFQPWSVQRLAGVTGAYACTITSATEPERTLTAPVAIAAHGSWLPLPGERVQRRLNRKPSDLFAFKANFLGSSLEAGLLPVLSMAGGYGGMVRADHDIVTLACCLREDRLKALRSAEPGKNAGDVVEAYLGRECAGVAQALAATTRDGPWLASGPLAPGIHLPRRGAPYFMIGNAAGEAHPIVGEGMSMALQSAWLLADLLIPLRARLIGSQPSQAVHRAALDRYARVWRRHFAMRLRVAAVFAHVAMRPRLGMALGPVLARMPRLLAMGAQISGKTQSAVTASTIARLAPGVGASR